MVDPFQRGDVLSRTVDVFDHIQFELTYFSAQRTAVFVFDQEVPEILVRNIDYRRISVGRVYLFAVIRNVSAFGSGFLSYRDCDAGVTADDRNDRRAHRAGSVGFQIDRQAVFSGRAVVSAQFDPVRGRRGVGCFGAGFGDGGVPGLRGGKFESALVAVGVEPLVHFVFVGNGHFRAFVVFVTATHDTGDENQKCKKSFHRSFICSLVRS